MNEEQSSDIDKDPKFTQGRVELTRIGDKIIPPPEVRQILTEMKAGK